MDNILAIVFLIVVEVGCLYFASRVSRNLKTNLSSSNVKTDGIKRMDIKEFRDIGLLQELNRMFLHPLGLALEVTVDDRGNHALGGIWDYRDDPEGMLFGDSDIDAQKADEIAQFIAKKHRERQSVLGFIVQPSRLE